MLTWARLLSVPRRRVNPSRVAGNDAQLHRVLGIIARWEKRCGMHADGEIVFPSSAAVASREWREQGSDDRVLVKRIGTLELVSRNTLAAALRAGGQRCTV